MNSIDPSTTQNSSRKNVLIILAFTLIAALGWLLFRQVQNSDQGSLQLAAEQSTLLPHLEKGQNSTGQNNFIDANAELSSDRIELQEYTNGDQLARWREENYKANKSLAAQFILLHSSIALSAEEVYWLDQMGYPSDEDLALAANATMAELQQKALSETATSLDKALFFLAVDKRASAAVEAGILGSEEHQATQQEAARLLIEAVDEGNLWAIKLFTNDRSSDDFSKDHPGYDTQKGVALGYEMLSHMLGDWSASGAYMNPREFGPNSISYALNMAEDKFAQINQSRSNKGLMTLGSKRRPNRELHAEFNTSQQFKKDPSKVYRVHRRIRRN